MEWNLKISTQDGLLVGYVITKNMYAPDPTRNKKTLDATQMF